jgi:hypothetical protein
MRIADLIWIIHGKLSLKRFASWMTITIICSVLYKLCQCYLNCCMNVFLNLRLHMVRANQHAGDPVELRDSGHVSAMFGRQWL